MQNRKPQQDEPLLLQRRMPRDSFLRSGVYVLWQYGLLLVACAVLTACTLLLSYGNLNPDIFTGYLEKPLIIWMNYAIVCSVALLLFAVIGKAWIAYLLTVLICMGIAVGNYFLIIIRNDPLQFEDLSCIREALAITDAEGYELKLSARLVFCIAACLGMTVLLALLARWRMRFDFYRLLPVMLAVLTFFWVKGLWEDKELYARTKYYKHVNTWSVTEIYVSRGILYSFAHSAKSSAEPPQGYSEAETDRLFHSYTDEDLPADRKVDVFVIMRESYADLSKLDHTEGAIDFSAYDNYHALVDDSVLIGTLVTNGFGGNTKNAERCFLTGDYTLKEWRKPANSYVWYLRGQGYYTEGAHPFNGWFYNRRNINRYLGFQNYMFREDGFDALVGADTVAADDVLYDCIWDQYQTFLAENDGPYFNFSVTYEGHGPYHYKRNDYPGRYVRVNAATANGYAMNNYLCCCARRDDELRILVDRFRGSDRPIVLLTFGDHKATLGADVNNYTTAAYTDYGMDMERPV